MDREWFYDQAYPDPNSGCLLFAEGPVEGYGIFSFPGSKKRHCAHRVAWKLAGRRTPTKDEVVRHRCDTPCCINVDHLLLGSRADNSADMALRRRQRRGSQPFGVQHGRRSFEASIRGLKAVNGTSRVVYLGSFATPEAAATVAEEARSLRDSGEFSRATRCTVRKRWSLNEFLDALEQEGL